MKLNYSAVIEVPPEALWPWLDDPEKCKQWMRGLLDVKQTSPGPKRKGTTAIMLIQEGGRTAEYQETILEYEPNKRFKLSMAGGCMKDTVLVIDYKLEDLGNRTRLDYECSAEMKGRAWLKLLAPVFMIFGRIQMKSFFKKLKRLAESEPEEAAAS
jgi:carbon monoxide dehydrogenase subunit G